MSRAALKLTTYFEERDRAGDRFLADALFDIYERHQMRTSVLLRGVDGFGQRHELHTDRLLTLSETLPAVSIAVDEPERIQAAVPDVLAVARYGLISLERALIADRFDALELPDFDGAAVKLTVYGGRGVRAGGEAGYVAAIDSLRAAGADGASVLLAVDGTLHGERRRARFLARNAHVPLILLAIGAREPLQAALPALGRLLEDPVATVERVQLCKSEGRLLSPPRPAEGFWLKLMVHVEEQAKAGRRPLYLELVRELRAAGAAGVTVLRGVRGFYRRRESFADRMLSLRRNVPVHVIAIDTAAAVERWWPVLDRLTARDGIVTCELVPATLAAKQGQYGPLLRPTAF